MSNVWHPDESQLLGYADLELENVQSGQVETHLDDCGPCRERVAAIRRFWPEYREAFRVSLPPPPDEWADLRTRLYELDAGRVRSRRPLLASVFSVFSRVDLRWAAAAAALIVGAVAVQITGGRALNAAELLRDAVRVEEKAKSAIPTTGRIRVKTRRASFTRPAARLRPESTPAEAEISGLFRLASYNWAEPLSARSFSQWRGRLPNREDRVRIMRDTEWGNGRFYHIRTSTPDNVLDEATITIRAEDLHPVQQTFHFRVGDEYVEISEAAEPPASPSKLAGGTSVKTPIAEIRENTVGAAEELRVIAALHSAGADLGDPVEISRDDTRGRVVVSSLVTDPGRQQQIRTALGGIPFVELRFERPDTVRTGTTAVTERRAALDSAGGEVYRRLAELSGGATGAEEFTNHMLDLSEAALARSYALKALAQRFPWEIEQSLNGADRAALRRIEEDHVRILISSVRRMLEILRPVTHVQPPGLQSDFQSWQEGAEQVLNAARLLDKGLTDILAGGSASDPEQALRSLSRSATELHTRSTGLQTVVARSERK